MLSSKGGEGNHANLSLYYDLFFSSVGLLCGGILIFQGWRLDPILLLCQILSSGTALFFIGESLWLRGANDKTKENVDNTSGQQQRILLDDPVNFNKIYSPIITENLYQEKKLLLPYIISASWETVNYTVPIDYSK